MKRTGSKFGVFIVALTLLFAALLTHAAAPNVRAWLDRDTMQMGESVTLNVESGDAGAAQPDFSVLKQDFNLLGTQSSQQVNITNGASQSKTLWAIGLEPKRAGHIVIAPISVGAASTAPIQLNVLAQNATASSKAGDDVFLEGAAEPLTPYVQQEVRYTVKLYYAFDLTDGNLSEPQADGIGVQRLGQEKRYIATLGNRRYNVVERHYALTPERSGSVDLPAIVFRGTALDVNDPSGFFNRGRAVAARSDAVRLDVKPKPAAWTEATWMPAATLLLKDESELPAEVHVGDPVTRTVRVQAQGLGFEQVPELDLPTVDGAEIYPDKAETRTRDDGEWRYGERVRKFAFVPNRAGTLTIPGLKMRWWDTVHDKAEIAELPSHTINVLPAVGGLAPPPQATAATATPAVGDVAARIAGAAIAEVPPDAKAWRHRMHVWRGVAILGFVLWLITLALWRGSRRQAPAVAHVTAASADASTQRVVFLRACALGEFAGAERALVAWARSERADVRNLGEVATRLADTAQRDALGDLQRTRYAGAPSQGLATRLQQAFQRGIVWREDKTTRRAASALPTLYPERD
ncbi:MAG: BatD family protein [Dokdonella sp.]